MLSTAIVDSSIALVQAIRANPAKGYCPKRILNQQTLLTVHYWGFDGRKHRGQIVVHQDVTTDVHEFFELAERIQFPFAAVVPLAHPDYLWDRDKTVLQGNLTYGFNWRTIHGTSTLSQHAHGLAMDVNPMQNPYVVAQGDEQLSVWPPVQYSPRAKGALHAAHPLVKLLESRSWQWGGHSYQNHENRTVRDYMHFEKHI